MNNWLKDEMVNWYYIISYMMITYYYLYACIIYHYIYDTISYIMIKQYSTN